MAAEPLSTIIKTYFKESVITPKGVAAQLSFSVVVAETYRISIVHGTYRLYKE